MKVNRLVNNSIFSIMVWCLVKLSWEHLPIDHTLSDKEHRPWNQSLPPKKLRMGVDLGSIVPKKGIKINTISQSSKAWKSVWRPYATPKVTKYQRCIFIIQIHKFTIKIDINLLFECVKIVEFNFNSHVFLVVYQDIRFLNQEARRQFLISSVSERDWKRNTGWNSRWLLIVSIFHLKWKWIFRRFAHPFAALRGLCERKYRWEARRISCKTSRGISTHFVWFVGDVWSSYGVCPGESTYSGFGTINAGNGLQITITCKTIQ